MSADIDECSEGTDTCHDNATCTDSAGSFSCECDSGYSGNGHDCSGECVSVVMLSDVMVVVCRC